MFDLALSQPPTLDKFHLYFVNHISHPLTHHKVNFVLYSLLIFKYSTFSHFTTLRFVLRCCHYWRRVRSWGMQINFNTCKKIVCYVSDLLLIWIFFSRIIKDLLIFDFNTSLKPKRTLDKSLYVFWFDVVYVYNKRFVCTGMWSAESNTFCTSQQFFGFPGFGNIKHPMVYMYRWITICMCLWTLSSYSEQTDKISIYFY